MADTARYEEVEICGCIRAGLCVVLSVDRLAASVNAILCSDILDV